MWDLLAQWGFAVIVCGVGIVFIRAMIRMDERRLAKMTQEERDQEWMDMQW
jgi:hypothetical protein